MGHGTLYHQGQLYLFGGSDERIQETVVKFDIASKKWKNHKIGGEKLGPLEFFGFTCSDEAIYVSGGRKGNQKHMDIYTANYSNDRKLKCSLIEDIAKAYKEDKSTSDVAIEGAAQSIKCHKVILKYRFPFLFNKMNISDVKP